MTKREKKRFVKDFFRQAGENVAAFRDMLKSFPDAAFYIKAADGRIVALNQRNCEICNIKDEIDAIGLTSNQLFPSTLAAAYMGDDAKVVRTGRPIVNALSAYPTDYSANFEYKSVFPIRDRAGRIVGTTCLYRLVPNPEVVPSWHGIMKKITLFINDHFAEPLTIRQLAALAGTSPSKFNRAFTSTLKISPGKFVANVRLTAARQMLESTNKTLVEIANETGFYDLSHFSRVFKRERGLTPGQYRRQHNANS